MFWFHKRQVLFQQLSASEAVKTHLLFPPMQLSGFTMAIGFLQSNYKKASTFGSLYFDMWVTCPHGMTALNKYHGQPKRSGPPPRHKK
jgi:hypothetical protein